MLFYYLIRRISSPNPEVHPLCQVVAFSPTREGISHHLNLVHEGTKVPPGTCYTIEEHPPNLSGREIERACALAHKQAEEKNRREEEEAYYRKVEAQKAARRDRNEQYKKIHGDTKLHKVTVVH